MQLLSEYSWKLVSQGHSGKCTRSWRRRATIPCSVSIHLSHLPPTFESSSDEAHHHRRNRCLSRDYSLISAGNRTRFFILDNDQSAPAMPVRQTIRLGTLTPELPGPLQLVCVNPSPCTRPRRLNAARDLGGRAFGFCLGEGIVETQMHLMESPIYQGQWLMAGQAGTRDSALLRNDTKSTAARLIDESRHFVASGSSM